MVPELSSSGVPQKPTDILIGYYKDAARQLRATVLKPKGLTQASKEFKSARAAVLVSQVDRILVELGDKSRKWVGSNLPKAAKDGIARAELQAKEAGVKPDKQAVAGSFHLINQGTVQILADDAARDLAKAARSMGDTAKQVLRQTAQIGLSEADIDKILAGGVITGQPVQTIRTLREELRKVHGDQVSIPTKSGGVWTTDVGYYAALVARTKTREANEHARHERLQELDLDLVAIVGRISQNFCTAFLGAVYSLSGKSTKYPPLSSLPNAGPPFHVQCSKSSRPWIEALASPKQQDLAEGLDDADKLRNVDAATAQRRFKDLQIYDQVKDNYASTAARLFGKAA